MPASSPAPRARRQRPAATYTHAPEVRKAIEAHARHRRISLSEALDEIVMRAMRVA